MAVSVTGNASRGCLLSYRTHPEADCGDGGIFTRNVRPLGT